MLERMIFCNEPNPTQFSLTKNSKQHFLRGMKKKKKPQTGVSLKDILEGLVSRINIIMEHEPTASASLCTTTKKARKQLGC